MPDPKSRATSSADDGVRGKLAAGLVFLSCALAFYYLSVLRIDLHRTSFLDLGPYPDAVEYFAQAESILISGSPTIRIGYDRLPSRYPPGYPLLMLPWLKLLPAKNAILAPFRTNQTIGALLLFGVFLFYTSRSRPLAGGLCAILFATQPWFTSYSRSSMSDLSGAVAAAMFFALIYLGLEEKRRLYIYLAAIVLGLSLLIRLQLIFLAPSLIAITLFPASNRRLTWWTHCVLVIAAFLAAASPYFLFNVIEFGGPLKTGYDFWVPAVTKMRLPFALKNVPAHFELIWRELSLTRNQFNVANLFGTGAYLVPSFVILSAAGVAFLKSWRFAVATGAGIFVFLAFTITYEYVELRFYLPMFVVMTILAVNVMEWAIQRVTKVRFLVAKITALGLFGCSIVGYPSESGWNPSGPRSQTLDAIRFASSGGSSPIFEAQRSFVAAVSNDPGIVLSNIDPVYLNVLLPAGFVSAPIDEHHSYIYSDKWHFGASDAKSLVRRGISLGKPIYALVNHADPNAEKVKYPLLEGYAWSAPKSVGIDVTVKTLVPEGGSKSRLPYEDFRGRSYSDASLAVPSMWTIMGEAGKGGGSLSFAQESKAMSGEGGGAAPAGTPEEPSSERSGRVDVKQFGAKGDGKSDDTGAFNAALGAVSRGGTCFVPSGKYLISSQGITSRVRLNVHLIGAGRDQSVLTVTGMPSGNFLIGDGDHWSIQDLAIDMADYCTSFGGFAAVVAKGHDWRVSNCAVRRIGRLGINAAGGSDGYIEGNEVEKSIASPYNNSAIITVADAQKRLPERIHILNNVCVNSAIYVNALDSVIAHNKVSGSRCGTNICTGVHSDDVSVIDNDCSNGRGMDENRCYVSGLELWAPDSVIANNRSHDNDAAGMSMGGNNCIVIGNRCWDNARLTGSLRGSGIVARAHPRRPNAASGSVFIANECYDTGSPMTQAYGYNEIGAGLKDIVLFGNDFARNRLGAVHFSDRNQQAGGRGDLRLPISQTMRKRLEELSHSPDVSGQVLAALRQLLSG